MRSPRTSTAGPLRRPRRSGPDASTTRLTLPGQDDPPARVDAAADAPVEVLPGLFARGSGRRATLEGQ